jgi:uncharacterized protein YehS (DUF1456 family)
MVAALCHGYQQPDLLVCPLETQMAHNEILRSIRDALQLDNATMISIFREAGREVGESAISAFLKTEDEDDYIPCSSPIMGFFLDGLIIHYRGRKEESTAAARPQAELGNNAILKKLRIALDLQEDDLLAIFRLANITTSKHELTALFRKEGHKHFKECTGQLLRGFIQGVGLRARS